MYSEKIDKMIMEALKAGEKIKAGAFRMLKSEFLVFKTAKNAKPLDEAAEISIIKKMIKQRQDAAKEYLAAGRLELADNELDEVEVLKVLLPAEITEEQIKEAVKEVANTTEPVKKNMGVFMKAVKAKYPTADGKMVSQIVSTFLS
jgi:uncharacterized protein YqeY